MSDGELFEVPEEAESISDVKVNPDLGIPNVDEVPRRKTDLFTPLDAGLDLGKRITRQKDLEPERLNKLCEINSQTTKERGASTPATVFNTLTVYPYRKPKENIAQLIRSSGGISATVFGCIDDDGIYHYPTGMYPRLVLLHVIREVIITGSQTVELSSTMGEFCRILGITKGTKQFELIEKAIDLVCECPIKFVRKNKGEKSTRHMSLSSDLKWNTNDKTEHPELFKSVIRINEDMYCEIMENHFWLDMDVIRAIMSGSKGIELDIYAWVVSKNYSLWKNGMFEQTLNMDLMYQQFGTKGTRPKDFNEMFWKALDKVRVACPYIDIKKIPGRKGQKAGLSFVQSPRLLEHHKAEFTKLITE